jgi:hypothetical protein
MVRLPLLRTLLTLMLLTLMASRSPWCHPKRKGDACNCKRYPGNRGTPHIHRLSTFPQARAKKLQHGDDDDKSHPERHQKGKDKRTLDKPPPQSPPRKKTKVATEPQPQQQKGKDKKTLDMTSLPVSPAHKKSKATLKPTAAPESVVPKVLKQRPENYLKLQANAQVEKQKARFRGHFQAPTIKAKKKEPKWW